MTNHDTLEIVQGPFLCDQSESLETPIFMCRWVHKKCQYHAWHDGHYGYCSAQDDENQHPTPGKGFYYPWVYAGKYIGSYLPNNECPYLLC